jgi:hypothetical protein
VPLPVVQALCGHGSPAIQAKYIHIGVDAAAQAVAAMPHTGKPLTALQSGLDETGLIRAQLHKLVDAASPDAIRRAIDPWRTHHEQLPGMRLPCPTP